MAPLWGLRPLTRYPRGDHWLPMPDVWVANPHRRVVLFEGRYAASQDQASGLSYTGQLWDNTAGGGGGGLGRSCTIRWGKLWQALVALSPVLADVWWVVCPSRSDIVATERQPDTLRRIHPTEWGLWGCVYYAG